MKTAENTGRPFCKSICFSSVQIRVPVNQSEALQMASSNKVALWWSHKNKTIHSRLDRWSLIRKLMAVAALAACGQAANAATAAGTLDVQATVVNTCVVLTTPVVFAGVGLHEVTANGSITVNCTNMSAFTVALDGGESGNISAWTLPHASLPASFNYQHLYRCRPDHGLGRWCHRLSVRWGRAFTDPSPSMAGQPAHPIQPAPILMKCRLRLPTKEV